MKNALFERQTSTNIIKCLCLVLMEMKVFIIKWQPWIAIIIFIWPTFTWTFWKEESCHKQIIANRFLFLVVECGFVFLRIRVYICLPLESRPKSTIRCFPQIHWKQILNSFLIQSPLFRCPVENASGCQLRAHYSYLQCP